MKPIRTFIIIQLLLCINIQTFSQKTINHQTQSWMSINTTIRIADKWGIIMDLHERRNHLFADNSFHFVRTGFQYWIKENVTMSLAYGHLWLAPNVAGWQAWSNENRIHEQIQMTTMVGVSNMIQRLRLEQRWQQKIVADNYAGIKFTNRIRYLINFSIPISKFPHYPSIIISDEMCMQFGKEIVYNTFDQNRFFIGGKQQLSKHISFDIGYMLVYQQKPSGLLYDENNTFRMFFYYSPDVRKK